MAMRTLPLSFPSAIFASMTTSTPLTIPSNVTMKAMVYGRHAVTQVERPLPRLDSQLRILIQVHAVGLNPVDAKNVLGDKLPLALQPLVQRSVIEGHIIGFDFSGTVVSSPVPEYKTGDAVFGTMPPLEGTLAEYIACPIHQLCPKPSILSFEDAAALPLVGLTALQSLEPYAPLGNVLVIGGSGGTGHVALSVAKALGACQIVAICSGRNREFCQSMGATHVVEYDSVSSVENQVDEFVARHGRFQVILDCVTSANPRDLAWEYPKRFLPYCDRRYLRLGGMPRDWLRASLEKCGCSCFGKEQLFWIKFPHSSHQLQQLAEWVDEEKIKAPHVSTVRDFTPENVQTAFEQINQRRVRGKIVITNA